MIKVLLIEDEIPAQKKILRIIGELNLEVEIMAVLDSVQEGKSFLTKNSSIDLILSDIELRDGNAFEIFEEVEVSCPIIFITAYNEYWMQAFETNGIGYLLKPFSTEKFKNAWDKFIRLSQQPENHQALIQQLKSLISPQIPNSTSPKSFKSRLSIPHSRGNYFIEISEIVYFFAEQGVIFGMDHVGKKHLLRETTLKEIEDQLDPNQFFRINRSQLVQKQFILSTERYSKNAVALKIKGIQELLVCSQSQTSGFLDWIKT